MSEIKKKTQQNSQPTKLLKSIAAYTYKIAHTKDDLGGESQEIKEVK